MAEIEATQTQMSQNLGAYWQEFRNFVEAKNSPAQQTGLKKQLKALTAALGSWHSQQQELLDSMASLGSSLRERLSEEETEAEQATDCNSPSQFP